MKDTKQLVEYMVEKSVVKANRKLLALALLSFMAGALISLGAVGNIISSADLYNTNQGLAKLIGACVFPVGLIVIILLGYELFTSNCMLVCAIYDKKITVFQYLKNLILVLFFNFLGCLFIAYITTRTHALSDNATKLLFSMAEHKVHASAYSIFLKGILCNILVCGASLIAYGTSEAIAKIFGIWFPIMLFILLGYDHIVANMLYLPAAYMLNSGITIGQILHNFTFATIGNFVGGAFFLITPLYISSKGVNNAKIKNIAIIAHVDHGKTTLVDALLKQSGTFSSHQKIEERIMDSNDLEKERGITIFSKNASINYMDYKINIVDTPGHADFGGEVQRILKMVDSVLLLVDAFEGVMPQTKYVLKQALEHGHNPIVVINKIDRPNSNPEEIVNNVFDLFVELGANEIQLDFPIVYTSAKNGIAKINLNDDSDNMKALFDTIINFVADPSGDIEKPLQMQIMNTEYDDYVGKLGTGRLYNGKISRNEEVNIVKRDGSVVKAKIGRIYTYQGLKKIESEIAYAGDILTIAGIDHIDIGETICSKDEVKALPLIEIDEPTLSMTFMVNSSPFAGRDGKYITSRNILERLEKEVSHNVSMKLETTDSPDAFIVKGRGELQLSILLENMRRESYEIAVSRPEVIFKYEDGIKKEPIELVTIDVAQDYAGTVIEKLGLRRGELLLMTNNADSYTRLEFKVPSRGLLGFTNEFLTDTRGTGILNHTFLDYEEYKGDISTGKKGALIAIEAGTCLAYALNNLQPRGILFVEPGDEVYEGMIVGEHSKDNDLVVNTCKGKKLTNMRAAGSDDNVNLAPAKKFTLELALEYISDDELVEITPNHIRLRKKLLSENDRKKMRNQLTREN